MCQTGGKEATLPDQKKHLILKFQDINSLKSYGLHSFFHKRNNYMSLTYILDFHQNV